MPEGLPLPGKAKPTERTVRRAQLGRTEDWRFPEKKFEKGKDHPGTMICPRCHAISEIKRWFLDEAKYKELEGRPDVEKVLCPGCRRIEDKVYEGEVILSTPEVAEIKDQAINLIHNTEKEARQSNPFARVALIEVKDSEIRVLTTTRWLSQRIGKEFKKAFHGELEIDNLPNEKFSRVRWTRAA